MNRVKCEDHDQYHGYVNPGWQNHPQTELMPIFPGGMATMIIDVEGFQCEDQFIIKELAL